MSGNESIRQSAYLLLSKIYFNAAEIWHTMHWDIMHQWPKTLEQMKPELALAVVHGMIREHVFGEPNKMFKYQHRSLSKSDLEELQRVFI